MFSFCMFCATGVVVVYFLQTSWFLAWMVLDQVVAYLEQSFQSFLT